MPAKLIVLFTLLISLSTMASKKEEEKITGVTATKVQIAELYDISNL